MLKRKIVFFLMLAILVFLVPTIANAAEVERNIYSNNGSMKFKFTELKLNKEHEYEFGLTKTSAAKVETWHEITEYTESTATVDIMTTTRDLREVINAVDTGYITIRDKTSEEHEIVLQPKAVNLKTPFLRVTNYTVIPNGKEFDGYDSRVDIALRNPANSEAYYQYEKITDKSIINKYKEIKAKNGNVIEMESMLKTTPPTSNWTSWKYWNGWDSTTGMGGYGYPQKTVTVPDSGLYYMWVYFSGEGIKNVYGYMLVDNLQPEIALESISLPKTEKLELGKTLTLQPVFNPENSTNKIVTWKSSDESVAVVNNAGVVTPKKVGSTIITVTSQDGNKTATCTVTVVQKENVSAPTPTPAQTQTPTPKPTQTPTAVKTPTSTSGNTDKGNAQNSQSSNGNSTPTRLPQTGEQMLIVVVAVGIIALGAYGYIRYRRLRDI